MQKKWTGFPPGATFIAFASLISLIVAGFWLLVFYPAVIEYDGLNMWRQAVRNSYINWYPPIMPMLMHGVLRLTGNVAWFSFLQAVLFTFSLLLLLREVIKNNTLLIVAAVIMLVGLPSLWIYPVMLFNNVWVAALAMLSATLLIKATKAYPKRRILWASLWLALAIAFRHEVFFLLIIPILVSQFLYPAPFTKEQIGRRLLDILLISFITLVPVRFIENLPIVEHNKPSASIFINQYFGIISYAQKGSIGADLVAEEKELFEQQFPPGGFDRSLEIYECGQPGILYSHGPRGVPPFSVSDLEKHQAFILSRIKTLAVRYPFSYLQHRFCNFAALLQVPGITANIPRVDEQLPQRPGQVFKKLINRLQLAPNSYFPQLRRWIVSTAWMSTKHPLLHWTYRHYIFIGSAALLLLASGYFKSWAIAIPAMFSVVALTGYLIVDGFSYGRYSLPSYIFAWVTIFAFLDYAYGKFSKRDV